MTSGASAEFEAACRRWSDRVAVQDATGEAITYGALFATALAFAERAAERGVAAGDLVAVAMADATAGHVLRMALLRLGATLIEGDPAGIRATYGLSPDWAFADRPAPAVTASQTDHVVSVDQSWIRPPGSVPAISGCGRFVLGTTGTTGTPKLRLMTEEAAALRWARASRQRGAPLGVSFIGYSPTSPPGFNRFMQTLLAGGTAVQPRPTDLASLEALDRCMVEQAFLAPHNFNVLLDLAEATGLRPRALEQIVVGGGALHPAVAERAEAHFGCPVFNTYGSTETSGISKFRVVEGGPGVVGRPHADVAIRFRTPDGAEALPDTGGEVLVRPAPGLGLCDYPAGAPLADAEGWIATGDIGRLDEAGRLCLSGRVHEMLNVGGTKRAPIWFEQIAMGYPGLRRVAAFGLPSPLGTEIVGLAVVAGNGFDLQAFAHFMQARLGPTYPMQIGEVDELPVNSGGKLDRRQLRDAFLAVTQTDPGTASGDDRTGGTP